MLYTYWRAHGSRRRRKRAQTTPDALFGPKVSFFIFYFKFFCTNLLYIGSIYAIHVSEATWKPAVTKTGPNDAGRVVWAKSEFFIFYFNFFCTNLLCIGSIYAIHVLEGTWKPAATKTGPNDAGRVVWAKSEFLLLLFRFFCC